MKKLLIVEEALKSADSGHWYEMMRSMAGACAAAGVETTIAAHRDVSPSIREELHALPAMPCSAWDGGYSSANPMKRYAGVLLHNLRLYRAVRRILLASDGFDWIFAPTLLVHHVLGWRWLAKRFGGHKFRRLTLLFVNPPGSYDEAGNLNFPRSSILLRKALESFAPLVRSGLVTLAADTRRTGLQFKQFCGLDFAVIPQPVTPPNVHAPVLAGDRSAGEQANDRQITFGSFGFGRHEQGTDLLQTAVRLILAEPLRLPAKFLIRWTRDFAGPDGEMFRPDPLLRQDPRVEFIGIGTALSSEEYLAQFARADALLLPYRRATYRDRSSRVAIEAAMSGKPMVYTKGTWLEELVAHCGAGVDFQNEDAADLASAIRQVAGNIAALKAEAEANAFKARAYFSPERFLDRLLAEPGAQGNEPLV